MSKKPILRKEIIGFSSVGAVSFIIDFVTFNFLVFYEIPSLYANLVAILFATIFGFVGNSLYSFKHKVMKGKELSLVTRYVIFTLLSLSLSVTLTSAVLSQISENELVMQNIGRTAVILCMIVLRFLGLKLFVYWNFRGFSKQNRGG